MIEPTFKRDPSETWWIEPRVGASARIPSSSSRSASSGPALEQTARAIEVCMRCDVRAGVPRVGARHVPGRRRVGRPRRGRSPGDPPGARGKLRRLARAPAAQSRTANDDSSGSAEAGSRLARGAEVLDRTLDASGLLRLADRAAVVDQHVAEVRTTCLRGTSDIRSRSILSASDCSLKPSRFESRRTWVSTAMPSTFPNALPSTMLAVLRATPRSVMQLLHGVGHLAAVHRDDALARRAERQWPSG